LILRILEFVFVLAVLFTAIFWLLNELKKSKEEKGNETEEIEKIVEQKIERIKNKK